MDKYDTPEHRAREAEHLQLIAGNPFDAEDMAMFEMFDREGFSPEQRRAYFHKDLERRRRGKETATASPS